MQRKLTDKQLRNILSNEVSLEDLDESGKILYHIGRFRRVSCDRSFEYLLRVVEPDINYLKQNEKWYIRGYTEDDIYQECSIMILKAIEHFDPRKGPDFRMFCQNLFKCRLSSLCQESTRYKNIPLNFSVSFETPMSSDIEGNSITIGDVVTINDKKLIDEMIDKEYYENLFNKLLSNLSPLESKVIVLYFKGYSYKEGALLLKISKKSFGNAVQRVKNKIEEIFSEEIQDFKKKQKMKKILLKESKKKSNQIQRFQNSII